MFWSNCGNLNLRGCLLFVVQTGYIFPGALYVIGMGTKIYLSKADVWRVFERHDPGYPTAGDEPFMHQYFVDLLCLRTCIIFIWVLVKVKVKCTFVRALRLCTGRTAHRGSRGIALLFYDHGTRRGEGSGSCPGRSLPRERHSTHFTGGWVGPKAGLDRCGKSCSHRDSIPGPSSP